MKVSILIPVYNKAFAIERVLNSLMPQLEPGDDVVVLDDGSTDESSTLIKNYDVKLVRRERSGIGHTIASARNLLVKESTHDQMIFLSGDCVPLESFIMFHKMAIDSAKPKTIFQGVVHGMSTRQPMIGYTSDWIYFLTGNSGINRTDFNIIGGFDEEFDGEWGGEDTEFAFRAVKQHNYRILRLKASVFHIDHPNPEKEKFHQKLKDGHVPKCHRILKDKHGIE